MLQFYIADQVMEWAKDNNVQISLSPSYNYTITRNATEIINEMPPFYQNVAQNAFTIIDMMVFFGFIGIGLFVTLRLVRPKDYDFFEKRKLKLNKTSTKPISFHKRLMIKLGLAEVKDGKG